MLIQNLAGMQEEMKENKHGKYAKHFTMRLLLPGQGSKVLLACAMCL